MKLVIAELQKHKRVAVLAPTGIAAVHIGGTTLHSWSGCGVPKWHKDFEKMWDKKDEIRETDVIVLDELSMLSGELFDRVEKMVRTIRCYKTKRFLESEGCFKLFDFPERPFGGIQLILCGDFLQLPPVKESPSVDLYLCDAEDVFLNRGDCFQAECWRTCNILTCKLEVVHRQRQETQFIDALHDIRLGQMSNVAKQLIKDCSNATTSKSKIKSTRLYCRNNKVEKMNKIALDELEGEPESFVAKDDVS